MSNPEARERWISSRVAFLNVMTEIIAHWKEISQLAPPGGPEGAEVLSRTKAIREQKRVTMTAAFLNALGVVSHNVLKDATNDTVDQSKLEEHLSLKLEPFRQINWDRDDGFWKDNLVVDGRVRTQTPALKSASNNLMALLD